MSALTSFLSVNICLCAIMLSGASAAWAGDAPSPCTIGNRGDTRHIDLYTGAGELEVSGNKDSGNRYGWWCKLSNEAELIETDFFVTNAEGVALPFRFDNLKIARDTKDHTTTVSADFYPFCHDQKNCPDHYAFSAGSIIARYKIFFKPMTK